MSQSQSWLSKPIKALLLDITGVLYESGTKCAIKGSIEAIQCLRKAGIPFRLVTNETQDPSLNLVEKLKLMGYDFNEKEIINPAKVVVQHLRKHQLRPHLLVHPKILPEFDEFPKENPNCVVIGDASRHFTYEATNQAFQLLMSLKHDSSLLAEQRESILISMGINKFYQKNGQLQLDLGAYTVGLEYATDLKAKIIGKPSADYFMIAVGSLETTFSEVVMIGDDIWGDVKGAQDCGMRGILVRTGKFRPNNENHPIVKPDAIVDNLKSAVDQILSIL